MTIMYSFPALSQVNTEADRAICTNSTTIVANYPGGTWTTTGGSTILNSNSTSTVVNNLDQGANDFTYTVIGVGSDMLTITNNSITANAGFDITASCLDYADLSGSAIPLGGSATWTLKYATAGVVIDNSTSNTTHVHNLPFGNTIFVWNVSANGCSSSDEVNINNSKPANNAGADKAGCSNIFYLSAENPPTGGSGIWSVAPGSAGIPTFDNTNTPDIEITAPRGTSVIRWSINYNTCSSFKDFNIVNNLPNPNAGIDQSICRDTVLLSATPPSIGEIGVWSVAAPQGEIFTNLSIYNPTVTNVKQGTSTFIWTISNGLCTTSDFMQVVNGRPSLNAGADNIICESTYTLSADNASPNIGTWTCNNLTVTFDNTQSNQTKANNLINDTFTFTWTVTNGNCTARDNVVIQSFNVPVSAGIDKHDCSDTIILSGTAVPVGGSGYWSMLVGEGQIDNSLNNITVARNIVSVSQFKWTINSGTCIFTDLMEFQNQLPIKAAAQADAVLCSNQALMTANSPVDINESGLWTIVSAGANTFIANPSLHQTMVSNLKSGINTFKWTINNQNCSTSDDVNLTNNSITTNAGADAAICVNTYSLAAQNAGGTGYWTCSSTGVVISNSLSPNSTVSNLQFGNNSFIWTRNDLGCTASDAVVITNNFPENTFAGSDKFVCEDLAHLTADNPLHGSGIWSVTSGAGTFSNASSYQTDVNAIALGNNVLRWTVTYQMCTDFDEVTISDKRIDLSAGTDQTVCNLPTITLIGTAPSGGQTGVWSIVGGNGMFSNSASNNSNVTNLIKGVNTFKWTVSDIYCTNSSQVSINNNSPDSAKAGIDQSICLNNTTVTATPVVNGVGSWSVITGGGNLVNPGIYSTLVNNIPNGLNTYRWTVNKNNCFLTDDLIVTNNSVNASATISQYAVCDPSHSATIVVNPLLTGESGLWTKISTGSGTILSPASNSTLISNLPNGESRYRWTVNGSFCSAYVDVKVVDDYYDASATVVGSADLCVDYSAVMGNNPPPTGFGAWSSSSGAVTFSNISSTNTKVQTLPVGTSTITWKITNNNCSSQASVLIKNNSFTANAGTDIVGCVSTANLSAQSLLAGQTGLWTSIYQGISFSNNLDPNSSISNIPVGSNQLNWTVTANGCTASDYMFVTNQVFSVSAGKGQTVCGTTYSLLATDPLANGIGTWTVIEGTGKIASSTKFNSTVSNLSNGNNSFRWQVIRNGCVAQADVNIINDLYSSQALTPPSVCVDEVLVTAIALPVGSGASGAWSTILGGGIFDNKNTTETMVRALSKGDNKFRWTVTKGACTSYKDIIVSNNHLIVSAGSDQIICTNNSSLYATTPSSTGSGIWTCSNNAVKILNPNSSYTDVENLSRGINTFVWSAIDKTCTDNASVTITNNDFTADAGIDQIVKTSLAQLDAQLPDANANGQWMVLNGDGTFSNYTSPNSDISNYTFGVNTFRWIVDWNGCSASDDVNLTYEVAEANAGDDQVTCNSYAVLLAYQPNIGTGIWSVVSGAGIIKDPANYKTLVSNISPGINTYRWTVTAFGAVAFDDVSITNNTFKANAGPDIQTCNNEINLNAEAAGTSGTGFWYIFQGSGLFENNTDNATKISGLMVGNNLYVWDVTRNGCNSKDTIFVYHYEPTSISNAGADATVCDKSDYILSANSPSVGKGVWSANNTAISFQNSAQFNSKVTNLPNGQYTLLWTITNTNCKSTDEVIISARKSISIVNQPASSTFKEGEIALITVQVSGDAQTYQWQKDGINLVNNSWIDGVNQSSLTISNLKISDIGNYQCNIIGYCNTVKSGIASISVISGIDDPEISGVTIFPNPSKGIVYLTIDNVLNTNNLSIATLNGEKVFSKSKVDKTEKIDLTNFANGIYLISLMKNNKLILKKLIIQK